MKKKKQLKKKIPDKLYTDNQWAELIEYLKENNLQAVVPLKGEARLEKK